MLWLGNDGSYLDANPSSRLVLRTTLSEIRTMRTYDLIPASHHAELEKRWTVLFARGSATGSLPIRVPTGEIVLIDYCGIANLLPAAHLFVWMPSRFADDEILDASARPAPAKETARLTERQAQVLRAVSNGSSMEEISHELALSVNTVKTHVRNAVQRLGARDRAHAVAVALRGSEI
jgi:DNA-binding CsgD family transcriptional regulator